MSSLKSITLLVATFVVVPSEYISDLVGMCLALLGGAAAQMPQMGKLPALEIAGELLASALAGFVVHAAALSFESPPTQRIVFASCICGGYCGAETLRYFSKGFRRDKD